MEKHSELWKQDRWIAFVLLLGFYLMHFNAVAQVVTHWKTSGGFNNWSRSQNWTNGIPGPSDIAVFDAGSKFCYLDIFPTTTVAGIIMNGYTGNLDLNDNTLQINGDNTFTTGTVTNLGGGGSGIVINTAGTTTFNGTAFSVPISGSSGNILFNGSVFNRTVNLTKTGAGNDYCSGGNVFGATDGITLTNASSSVWRLAAVTGDTFGGISGFGAKFINSGTGSFEPAYNGINSFSGSISVSTPTSLPVVFGVGTGVVQFTGPNNQLVYVTGVACSPTCASPVMNRIEMNKSSNTVTLDWDVIVGVAATFTNGVINSSSSPVAYLIFADNATVSGANNSSYVDGPVRKTGNDVFTFPVGDNNIYRPISISAPANVTDQFTAQYFRQTHTYGTATDPSFATLSRCEYWVLDRTTGTSNVNVTLSWNSPDCPTDSYITSLSDLRVSRWNGSQWVNHGNGGTTGNATSGTVTSSAAVTSFSPFTLASVTTLNPLPIELLDFTASRQNNSVLLEWKTASELNSDHFSVERSSDGAEFTEVGKVQGHGTTSETHAYNFADTHALSEKNYYRLKQIDFDGLFTVSPVRLVNAASDVEFSWMYPNPVAVNETVFFIERTCVQVMDQFGRVISSAHDTDRFNAVGLAPGVYLLRNLKNGQVVKLAVK